MTRVHEELLREFQEWSRTAATPKALMERITQRLHEKMTKYNWVGFYLVYPVDSGFLVLDHSSAVLHPTPSNHD